MAAAFTCGHCMSSFRLKHIYQDHKLICIKRNNLNEETPIIPIRHLYQVIHQLAVKCDKLEKEVKRLNVLESYLKRKTKKEKMEEMFANYIPKISFNEWIRSENMVIEKCMLTQIWDEDLLSGIKLFIEREAQKHNHNLPIRCFYNKNMVFYIWQDSQILIERARSRQQEIQINHRKKIKENESSEDEGRSESEDEDDGRSEDEEGRSEDEDDEFEEKRKICCGSGKWVLMKPENWEQWLKNIEHRFLQVYIDSISKEEEGLVGGRQEEEEERQILFMQKISDIKNSTMRRIVSVRKWIIPLIAFEKGV